MLLTYMPYRKAILLSANTTTPNKSNTEFQAELLGIDKVTDTQEALENARIGYQVAVSLWMYEGGLIWSKYNSMLVVNSLILGVIGITRNIKGTPGILSLGLPIAGVLLCIAWLQLTKRGFEQHSYWISSALRSRPQTHHRVRPVIDVIRASRYTLR